MSEAKDLVSGKTEITPMSIRERFAGVRSQETLSILAILEEVGADPFRVMGEICADETSPKEIRLSAAKELATYIAPKRRAVDNEGKSADGLVVQIVKFGNGDDKLAVITDADKILKTSPLSFCNQDSLAQTSPPVEHASVDYRGKPLAREIDITEKHGNNS
jgi:hypothetical protein